MPIFSFSTPASLSTSKTLLAIFLAMYSSACSAHFHVMAGRMRPAIQGASILAHSESDPTVSNRTGSPPRGSTQYRICLLYTSDAADDLLCVDLGGRRIIKKKK